MRICREEKNRLISGIERCLKYKQSAESGDEKAILVFNVAARDLNEVIGERVVNEIESQSVMAIA